MGNAHVWFDRQRLLNVGCRGVRLALVHFEERSLGEGPSGLWIELQRLVEVRLGLFDLPQSGVGDAPPHVGEGQIRRDVDRLAVVRQRLREPILARFEEATPVECDGLAGVKFHGPVEVRLRRFKLVLGQEHCAAVRQDDRGCRIDGQSTIVDGQRAVVVALHHQGMALIQHGPETRFRLQTCRLLFRGSVVSW